MGNNRIISDLKKERERLVAKIEAIDDAILSLQKVYDLNIDNSHIVNVVNVESAKNDFVDKYSTILEGKTLREKVLLILKTEQRFMHIREFAKILVALDSSLSEEQVRNSVSSALSALKNANVGNLKNIMINNYNANTFWGSKNWLEENGVVKEKYKYDENYILTNKSETNIEL